MLFLLCVRVCYLIPEVDILSRQNLIWTLKGLNWLYLTPNCSYMGKKNYMNILNSLTLLHGWWKHFFNFIISSSSKYWVQIPYLMLKSILLILYCSWSHEVNIGGYNCEQWENTEPNFWIGDWLNPLIKLQICCYLTWNKAKYIYIYS